jgi:hypothetical protein
MFGASWQPPEEMVLPPSPFYKADNAQVPARLRAGTTILRPAAFFQAAPPNRPKSRMLRGRSAHESGYGSRIKAMPFSASDPLRAVKTFNTVQG